jgi:putative ABC transport system ATP-binding protein
LGLAELVDIARSHVEGDRRVISLDAVNLTVEPGDYLAIVGPRGSGKTALFNTIGCLEKPDRGSYRLGGIDVLALDDDETAALRARMLGLLFESADLIPDLTVAQNVELNWLYRGDGRDARKRALEVLSRLAPQVPPERPAAGLAGLDAKLVALARAIVGRPALLLADAPTGDLDAEEGARLLDLLEELNQVGFTIVLTTDDEAVAARAGRYLRLAHGRFAES